MQALAQLAEWQRQHKLVIIAVSRVPVTLPWELERLGTEGRYTSTAC